MKQLALGGAVKRMRVRSPDWLVDELITWIPRNSSLSTAFFLSKNFRLFQFHVEQKQSILPLQCPSLSNAAVSYLSGSFVDLLNFAIIFLRYDPNSPDHTRTATYITQIVLPWMASLLLVAQVFHSGGFQYSTSIRLPRDTHLPLLLGRYSDSSLPVTGYLHGTRGNAPKSGVTRALLISEL